MTANVISASDYETVRTLLRRHAAVVLDDGKEYLVEARLGPLAQKSGFSSLSELMTRLRNGPGAELCQKVVEAMTIHETSFFRDWKPFDALRNTLLPQLLQRRAPERKLAIWSAACSSGQEPYTLAMLLRDHFPQLEGWSVRLIATDISNDILARARAGKYTQLEVNRGLPAPALIKHFERKGLEFVAKDYLRNSIDFRQLNLAEPWPDLGQVDVVFLRNVLIYFSEATKRDILERIARLLRRDGYVFLGTGETTLNLSNRFERVPADGAGVYRLVSEQGR